MQLSEINCSDRKLRTPKFEYYDADGNLSDMIVPQPVIPNDINDNSPFGILLRVVCSRSSSAVEQVQGTYEGTNSTTYEKGGEGEQRMSIIVS